MAIALLTILILMHLVFFCAVWKKRNDYADVIWGPGFLIAALAVLFWQWKTNPDFQPDSRTLIVLSCLALWSIRLFMHIGLRNLRKTAEDTRYAKWRQEWGSNWLARSYFQVFILQGLIMWVIAWPVVHVITSEHVLIDPFFEIGFLVWIVGFLIESIADEQLRKFTANSQNKGRIMDAGLWSWSRHPNYFGEVVQWWGIFLMAVQLEEGWMTVVSPLVITFLILKVSGVPMLEKMMEGRLGFEAYKKRTSVFFPLPPQKN